VVVAELTDRTFRTERDVEDELHLPVLVEVGSAQRSARKA
jgi:capsular polysaccharide biosynthesis protein